MSPTWRRLIRFIAIETNLVHYGEPVDANLDVGAAYESFRTGKTSEPIKAREVLGGPFESTSCEGNDVFSVKKLLSPLDPAHVRSAMCMGFNYASHAKEAKSSAPTSEHPNYFNKPPSCVADPSGSVIIPQFAHDSFPDYEGEIVAILGRPGKNIPASEAESYLLGYTLANDISARTIQLAVSQASFGKSLDTFMPLGPVIVNASQFSASPEIELQTEFNGEIVQSASTKEMISSIPELVEQLSRGITLQPGTIILTGTPEGTGFRSNPRTWLKHGDMVVVKGSLGLGSLYSHIVYED